MTPAWLIRRVVNGRTSHAIQHGFDPRQLKAQPLGPDDKVFDLQGEDQWKPLKEVVAKYDPEGAPRR